MTLDTLILFAGGFILLEPWLGIPATWDSILITCAGVFVVTLGIAVRRRGLKQPSQQKGPTSQS
jgi:hypothetical protein